MRSFFKSSQPIVVYSDDSESEGELERTDEKDELERNHAKIIILFTRALKCVCPKLPLPQPPP